MMAMDGTEHPIQVLCDPHVIPMLMFLGQNGPSTKTVIYSAVGRSANMPSKIDRMREAGLVTVDEVGISEVVGLTDLGGSVADSLVGIDAEMSAPSP